MRSKGKGPMMGTWGEALGLLPSMPTGYSSFGPATIKGLQEHSSCPLFCFMTRVFVNAFLMLWSAGKPNTSQCLPIKDCSRSEQTLLVKKLQFLLHHSNVLQNQSRAELLPWEFSLFKRVRNSTFGGSTEVQCSAQSCTKGSDNTLHHWYYNIEHHLQHFFSNKNNSPYLGNHFLLI